MATRGDRPRKPRRTGSAERTRKAFARRQRARRWLTWRYLLVALVGVLAIALAVYAIYFSAWLRADKVEVVGNEQLTDKQVLEAAEARTGGPLATVDVEAIRLRIKSLATVKSVDVSRHWPHAIRIEIVERTPVAVLERGDIDTYLDEDGVAFGRLKQAPEELPKVRVGGGADENALKEGAAVVGALDPEVAALVSYVEVRTVDEILLHLRDDRLVRWGSADQAEDKAAVLLTLLERKASTYDVSVPDAPTTS